MFKKIDPKLNLPQEEEKVLEFWREDNTFKKSLQKESPKGNFVFFEGPPTANGQPGIHHVEARSFKDLFARYKTMQGFFVKRKAGWDTHGLPVELQVEKELGISGKPQIESIVPGDKTESIKKFNDLCKKSVWRYKEEWEKMTERMAYWVDMEDPYITYEPKYIESVWNIISEIDKKGLLYKGHKVVPYCPRCGTALSSHEVAQGYKNVKEESIYFQLKSSKEDVYFLVWTTTPWTLSGNAALAFGPNIDYALVEKDGRKYILGQKRVEQMFGEAKILKTFSGLEVVEQYSNGDKDYEPIYPDGENFSEAGEKAYKLIAADYVSDADGTGIVHIAPAFGEDDYIWGFQKNGIKVLKTVDEKGTELAGAGKGEFVKKADEAVKTDLESRNILFRKELFAHDYPFCWRCGTPLLYFAKDSWYIAMSKLRDNLLDNNEKINWNPAYLKHGRFGNWLENINDWAISRDRYWGTPLPVWECEKCHKYKVVKSFNDFKESNQKITKLLLVRHGESEKNVLNILSSDPNKWPLTENGKAGVKKVAEKINENIDVIISSPILRAKQTAEILNEKIGLNIVEDELVREIDFGEWKELTKPERQKLSSHIEYRKIKNNPSELYPYKYGKTGESRADYVERIEKFIKKVIMDNPGKTVLVVAHGGLYACVSKVLEDISHEEFFNRQNIANKSHDNVFEFYATQQGKGFDPHKPFIDEVEFTCECGGKMKRTPEVMDVWLDSGTMPFSQYHWPFENEKLFAEQFPADFISEAVDQTRGWFYTLLAVSTIIKNETPFKNVISVGHILDAKGKKMSKSLGNIVVPKEAFDKYGADVVRYYFYSVNQPGEPKLFADKEVLSISRNLFLTLWNVYSFFMTYASIDQFVPKGEIESENVLDQWILAKYQLLVNEMTDSLEAYDPYKASNIMIDFVAELSTWYVRRSRKRFWKSENDTDKIFAYETLYYVLVGLTKLLAPMTPMFAELIYSGLRQETDLNSVHLTKYPQKAEMSQAILEKMNQARQIVEAGLSARSEAKIKIRQPLQSLTYFGAALDQALENIIAEEVNVKKVINSKEKSPKLVELDLNITPELKMEGLARDLVRNIQSLRKKSNFQVEDRINLFYQTSSDLLNSVMKEMSETIAREVLALSVKEEKGEIEGEEEFNLDGEKIWIGIKRANS